MNKIFRKNRLTANAFHPSVESLEPRRLLSTVDGGLSILDPNAITPVPSFQIDAIHIAPNTNSSIVITPAATFTINDHAISGTIGHFIDTAALPTSPNAFVIYVGTIAWGDGQSSAAQIVANTSGGYDVVGSHTYTTDGDFDPSLTIYRNQSNLSSFAAMAISTAATGGQITATVTNDGTIAVSIANASPAGTNVAFTFGADSTRTLSYNLPSLTFASAPGIPPVTVSDGTPGGTLNEGGSSDGGSTSTSGTVVTPVIVTTPHITSSSKITPILSARTLTLSASIQTTTQSHEWSISHAPTSAAPSASSTGKISHSGATYTLLPTDAPAVQTAHSDHSADQTGDPALFEGEFSIPIAANNPAQETTPGVSDFYLYQAAADRPVQHLVILHSDPRTADQPAAVATASHKSSPAGQPAAEKTPASPLLAGILDVTKPWNIVALSLVAAVSALAHTSKKRARMRNKFIGRENPP